MNGAFDRIRRIVGRAHPVSIADVLGGVAVPALAAAGTLGVVAVLVGLQCGGLDRCFATAPQPVAVVEPPAASVAPDEPRLVADEVVVAAEVEPVAEIDPRARQIDTVIVGSFDAIRADDEGWLSGALSAEVSEEGDGAGPDADAAPASRVAAGADGDEAMAAIAALDQPLRPVPRPEPLAVAAFADTRATSAAVAAAAQQQLAEVAGEPDEAAPADEAEPAQVADVAAGETRTVTGAGVNVRSGPGKSSSRLFSLVRGQKVKVSEDRRGWLRITDDKGRTGWIYKTYVN